MEQKLDVLCSLKSGAVFSAFDWDRHLDGTDNLFTRVILLFDPRPSEGFFDSQCPRSFDAIYAYHLLTLRAKRLQSIGKRWSCVNFHDFFDELSDGSGAFGTRS